MRPDSCCLFRNSAAFTIFVVRKFTFVLTEVMAPEMGRVDETYWLVDIIVVLDNKTD